PPPEAPPVTPPRVPTEIRTDEIHFESGSARLTNIAKAILDDVALRMKQEPTSTAIVIGYTDNREATGPNADLDRRRAEAVRDYLVSRHGIDPSRITIEGRDAREPVGDNNTAEGRLKNRRVVIRLILPSRISECGVRKGSREAALLVVTPSVSEGPGGTGGSIMS